jgi:hypothetical protein
VFGLKTRIAGAIEFGLASGMKPLTVLKQARFDLVDARNILAAKPKRIAHACGTLLGRSLSRRRAGRGNRRQHQNATDENSG